MISMVFLKSKYFLPIGIVTFVIAMVLGFLFPPYPVVNFLAGVFGGLSVTLNIAGLAANGRRLGTTWFSD